MHLPFFVAILLRSCFAIDSLKFATLARTTAFAAAPPVADEVEEIVDGADVTTGAAADAGLREVALRRVLALRASACADRDEWRAVVVDVLVVVVVVAVVIVVVVVVVV